MRDFPWEKPAQANNLNWAGQATEPMRAVRCSVTHAGQAPIPILDVSQIRARVLQVGRLHTGDAASGAARATGTSGRATSPELSSPAPLRHFVRVP